jgi:predicted Zn-dependent protease
MPNVNAELGYPDKRHLDAAEGWLGLGNWSEANAEMENIAPRLRAHPEVLRVRYGIYALAKDWEQAAQIAHALAQLAPGSAFGWIHHAYALHELGRTQQAWNVLRPVASKFPTEYIICYNLACYACRLGDLRGSIRWLTKAIGLAGSKQIKSMALEDPDLEPLRAKIAEM